MDYVWFPTTDAPWQQACYALSPDGFSFSAKVDLRLFPADGRYYFSLADAVSGRLYVPWIPLVASWGPSLNDLLQPFRYLNQGRGIGSLFCVHAVDHPRTPDPAEGTLSDFRLIYGDVFYP